MFLELSQLREQPQKCPIQPSFRHLCNILQINDFDISAAKKAYSSEITDQRDERRFQERSERAIYWIENYAPDEFKFRINKEKSSLQVSSEVRSYLDELTSFLEKEFDNIESDKELHEKMYEIMHAHELKPGDIFEPIYQLLITREKGPKLAGFIRTIGKDRVIKLLS